MAVVISLRLVMPLLPDRIDVIGNNGLGTV